MLWIGEKLNGAVPSIAAAIAEGDGKMIERIARAQAEAGADFLDVSAATTAEELQALRFLIENAEKGAALPICIDSPDPMAVVQAMAFCSRPGLLNSVSMEGRKADIIFPAMQGNAWRAVALLSDDSGTPDSVEERMAVLERLLECAGQYGIEEERLYVDPLVEALPVSPNAFLKFAACARAVKAAHPRLHVLGGMSNISYGLPERRRLYGAFLKLAAEAGVDAIISDPRSKNDPVDPVAEAALLGRDPGCRAYITACTHRDAEICEQTPAGLLMSAVERGDAERGGRLAEEALRAGAAPLALLDGMTETMAELGRRFAAGTVYIPELIMAAKTMQAATEVLKPLLGENTARLGTVVIGTVMGDVHDIGKNLVAMMLEGAGFTVIDLGTDVYTEDFIEAVEQHPETKIIALSALLTTTMPAMRDTVRALRQEPCCRGIRIMVGGAPVTETFAQQIGADAYTQNAAMAAERARELIAQGG